jgi:hypothetical protein
MIVNFKSREINRNMCKLARTFILIIIIIIKINNMSCVPVIFISERTPCRWNIHILIKLAIVNYVIMRGRSMLQF